LVIKKETYKRLIEKLETEQNNLRYEIAKTGNKIKKLVQEQKTNKREFGKIYELIKLLKR